jgi:hypothetical protein
MMKTDQLLKLGTMIIGDVDVKLSVVDGVCSVSGAYSPYNNLITIDVAKLREEARAMGLLTVNMFRIVLAHELGHWADPFIKDDVDTVADVLFREDRAWLFGYDFIDVYLLHYYDKWNSYNKANYRRSVSC